MVENIVQMMEKSVMNLENLVLERSADLVVEQERTELLLQKMLPR